MKTKKLLLILLIVFVALLIGCERGGEEVPDKKEIKEDTNPAFTQFDVYDVFADPDVKTPKHEDYFATVYVEDTASINLNSDGDLWPCAWADDDALYVANGDGAGFSSVSYDINLGKITGTPYEANMVGRHVASSSVLSKVWIGDQGLGPHNKKPTGMVCVDGVLYMAVQDLNCGGSHTFNEAPAATIIKSTDHGKTWEYDRTKPMFSNYKFTTIMFLDYGKDSSWNEDGYVYAYGLDYNWRDSFDGCVNDPQNLYLARIPKDSIMDTSKWEYYKGDLNGNAAWTEPGDIDDKRPVLRDFRRVYSDLISGGSFNYSVLSQGSIVYNKALDVYIYASWTEYTYEFYFSKTPWGEWKHFYSKDFGKYPWSLSRYGGYGTVMPSKYISEDGLTMYICSCTFVGGVRVYQYSLRKMVVTLPTNKEATNKKSDHNLANFSYSDYPNAIYRMSDIKIESQINDMDYSKFNSSYNGCKKLTSNDYWGITYKSNLNFNEIIYTVGEIEEEKGGWFEKMKVQVRQNGLWVDATGLDVSSNYTYSASVESFAKVKMTFNDTWGDGIRIIGIPGGSHRYTTIAELEVYYR